VVIQVPKKVVDNIDQFHGREWLLPKVLEWWHKGKDRLFLLTGEPGTGKSMIIGWLGGFGNPPINVTPKAELAQVRTLIKAVHFCQAASRNVTPQAFADSMAHQLTSTCEGFGDALASTLADRVQIVGTQSIETIAAGGIATNVSIGHIDLGMLGDELSFDRAFIQPLKKFYANGHREPILLLVDALDEAQTYTGVKLPELLSRLSDLPVSIRLLLTTREEPRILKFFHDTARLDLSRDGTHNLTDVRTYVDVRLAKVPGLADQERKDFAVRLTQNAEGNFLYATTVLDELLRQMTDGLPHLAMSDLPEGLSGLYHNFLTRELGRDDQYWFGVYEPLLGLIAVAQGEGLTAQQLTAILGKDIRAALRSSKQYLTGELPNGPFRPFHKSFSDYLLEDKNNQDFHIDASAMHGIVSKYYWKVGNEDWSRCDNYGLANLAGHLYHAGKLEQLEELIDEEWMQVRVSREENSYDGFLSDAALLWQEVKTQTSQEAPSGNPGNAFINCVRLALIRSSAYALSRSVIPELAERAIETKLWSIGQTLSVLSLHRDHKVRARILISLLKTRYDELSEQTRASLVLQAGEAINGTSDEDARRTMVQILSQYTDTTTAKDESVLPQQSWDKLQPVMESLETQRDALARIQNLIDVSDAWIHGPLALRKEEIRLDQERAETISKLALRLDETLIGQAFIIASNIRDEEAKSVALSALAPRLRIQDLEKVITYEPARDYGTVAAALNKLAGCLPETYRLSIVRNAVTVASQVREPLDRVMHLITSAELLTGPEKEALLRKALTAAPLFGFEQVAWRIGSELFGQLYEEAVAKAGKMDSDYEYHWAMAGLMVKHDPVGAAHHFYNSTSNHDYGILAQIRYLASTLGTDDLQKLLGQTLEIESEDIRAECLTGLAPYLKGVAFNSAFNAARTLDGGLRSVTMAKYASYTPQEERQEVLWEVLTELKNSTYGWHSSKAMEEIAPLLGDSMLKEAFRIASLAPADENEYEQTARISSLIALDQRMSSVERAQLLSSFTEDEEQGQILHGLNNNSLELGHSEPVTPNIHHRKISLVSDFLALAEIGTPIQLVAFFSDDRFEQYGPYEPTLIQNIADVIWEVAMLWKWPSPLGVKTKT